MINDVPLHLYNTFHPTGSNYICNPPVTNTDIDYVISVKDFQPLHKWLLSEGWTPCKGDNYTTEDRGKFQAYRLDEFNFIVVEDEKQYGLWVKATEKAKELNLTNKADRIKLFNEVFGVKKEKTEKTSISSYAYWIPGFNITSVPIP